MPRAMNWLIGVGVLWLSFVMYAAGGSTSLQELAAFHPSDGSNTLTCINMGGLNGRMNGGGGGACTYQTAGIQCDGAVIGTVPPFQSSKAYGALNLAAPSAAFAVDSVVIRLKTDAGNAMPFVLYYPRNSTTVPGTMPTSSATFTFNFTSSGAGNATVYPGDQFELDVQLAVTGPNKHFLSYGISIIGGIGCSSPPVVNKASVSPSGVTYALNKATFTYTCDAGYAVVGINVIQCQQGTYNGTGPSCQTDPNWCTLPTIANGTRGSCSTTIGGACSYSCNSGYTFATTSPSAVCSASQTYNYSTTPGCVPYSGYCNAAAMVPQNGVLGAPCDTSIYGRCTVNCNPGYSPATQTHMCQASGTYETAVCSLITNYCSLPAQPFNGNTGACGQAVGQLCYFSCFLGYNTSQSLVRQCMPTAVYNGSDVACGLILDWCPYPPAPMNGSIGGCNRFLGGRCDFTCSPAFIASAATRTCNSSRQFSGSPVTCTLNAGFCSIPPAPLNGFVVSCNASLAGYCQFGCQPGYNATNPVRQCLGTAQFSGANTTCDLITEFCPAPTPPAHSSVNLCPHSVGSSCSFTCDTGYDPSGSAWTCSTLGTWSVGSFACYPTPAWCTAPSPGNGNVATCPGTIGSTCNITCVAGYQRNAAFATCQLSQSYDVVLSCTTIVGYCPAPSAIGNATLSTSDGTIGSVVTVTCNVGYEGGGQLTCTAGGVFTGSPVPCTLIQTFCYPATPPTNGYAVPGSCDRRLGGACLFACNDGFNDTGLTRYCQADRYYNAAVGSCVAVDGWCTPPLAPPNGARGTCLTSVGGVCQFSCNAGYQAASTASLFRTCQSSGQYDQTDLNCIQISGYCTAPPVISSGVLGNCGTEIGGPCCFTCNAGYSAPAYNLTCSAGGVYQPTNSPTCTPITGFCQYPVRDHGNLTENCQRQLGGQCSFACDEGYEPLQTQVTCSLSGQVGVYSGVPNCLIVKCGSLGQSAPANGQVTCTGNSYGDTCTFTCGGGFTLSGTGVRTCTSVGTWDGASDATCVAGPTSTSTSTTTSVSSATATGVSTATTSPSPTSNDALVSGGSSGSSSSSGGGATGAIIGAIVGVVVVLILVAILITVMRKRNQQKEAEANAGSATVRASVSTEDIMKRRVEKMLSAKNTEIIGTGAFAKVYRAKLEDDWVALKVLNEGVADAQGQAEFHREATILSRMGGGSHPNVIALRFFCQKPLAMALELAESGSLYVMIRDKQLPITKHVTYAGQIASGMAFLHAQDVAHLDLKPENVLLGDQGQTKITDFGCAVIVGTDITRDENGNSEPIQFLGTPQYAGPERFSNKPYNLFKADVYSFAMIVWSMITGETPFANKSVDDIIETLALDASSGNSKSRFTLPANVNATLAAVVAQGFDAFPKRPSFAQIAADLGMDDTGTATVKAATGQQQGLTANPAFLNSQTGSVTLGSASSSNNADSMRDLASADTVRATGSEPRPVSMADNINANLTTGGGGGGGPASTQRMSTQALDSEHNSAGS